MGFRRGFKAQCETMALQIRRELAVRPDGPLTPDRLAAYLRVRLLTPADVSGLSPGTRRILLGSGSDEWSAVTVAEHGNEIIIHNPNHSPARQASDIMHELAHLILAHKPSAFMFAPDNTWAIRSYDSDQEEEANWLSGCLLLPRPALLSFERRADDEVCREYGVSQALLRYRRNASGVAVQLSRRRPRTHITR